MYMRDVVTLTVTVTHTRGNLNNHEAWVHTCPLHKNNVPSYCTDWGECVRACVILLPCAHARARGKVIRLSVSTKIARSKDSGILVVGSRDHIVESGEKLFLIDSICFSQY